MAQQPQRPPGPTYAYVDLPELSETLADSVHSLLFDGQTLRITFAVNRMDPSQPPQGTGRRYPVCRLVLTGPGIAELVNQVNQLGAVLAQAQAQAKSGPPKVD
jgi:hypothetical protein